VARSFNPPAVAERHPLTPHLYTLTFRKPAPMLARMVPGVEPVPTS